MNTSPGGFASPAGTLLLTRSEIARLLSLEECIAAVEQAFRLHAEGKSLTPGVLSIPSSEGAFHTKAAGLELGRTYFAAKTNGNFFLNRKRFGLPNIQGIILLCDGTTGTPLALLDSIEITILRTGAATAVASKHLALPDSAAVTICGCGNQGRVQLRALARVRGLERVYAYDLDTGQAEAFAQELSRELEVEIRVVRNPGPALRQSTIGVTCTPSRRYFLTREDVGPGTFLAAVGADDPTKQELEPELVAASKIVVDSLDQCARIGELHHALAEGLLATEAIHAELAEVVAGRKPGRTSREETIIFDSTGVALEDVAAAAAVYEKALRSGSHRMLDFAS